MSKYKIVMTDTIFPDSKIETEVLGRADAELVLASAKDSATLAREGADADGLLVVYAEVTPEVIAKLDKCKVMVRCGIGFNNIALKEAAARGIKVANVPDYCQGEVADHAMALFLSLTRQIYHYVSQVKGGGWSSADAPPMPRLQGGVFGLLGCGSIGIGVGRRAQAFGMSVVTFDPYANEAALSAAGIKRIDDLDTFLSVCDCVSLHVPMTPETERIINARTIGKMKRTAVIVNTARGPLIDEEALYDALKAGIISGAALDVLTTEPPPRPLKLAELPNCLITPHAAFASTGATPELRTKAAEEIVRTLTTGTPKFWVNKSHFV